MAVFAVVADTSVPEAVTRVCAASEVAEEALLEKNSLVGAVPQAQAQPESRSRLRR